MTLPMTNDRILAVLAHCRDGLERDLLAERLSTPTPTIQNRLTYLRKLGFVAKGSHGSWHITEAGVTHHNSHKVRGGF